MTLEQTQRVEVDSAGQTSGVVDGLAIAPDRAPAPQMPVGPQAFCFACGAQIDARAEICPKCGVRQGARSGPSASAGKDRVVAIVLALLLGGLGLHKFYLGKVLLGVIYLLFSWTGIPSLIGWIEAIVYLRTSDAAWAAEHGGPVQSPSSTAIGCLWILALLPLLAMVSIVGLIFLGSQVNRII